MIRRAVRRRPVATAVLVVAALAAAAGITWAAIPDSGGVFTGCYSTTSTPRGALRVIDPSAGQACQSGEVKISWNAKGINWKGPWSAATAYKQGDAVSLNGGSYIAIAANTNHTPPNATYWGVLAQKGAAGAAGQRGPAGVLYFDQQEIDGPLPATVQFTGVPAGRGVVRVEGTAYSSTGGRSWVTVTPSSGTIYCGAGSRYPTLYFNQTGVHAVLMPMTWQVCFTDSADRSFTLDASSTSLQTDPNDFFTVSLTVYPPETAPAATRGAAKAGRKPAPGMSPGT